jgi:hypothetical protein
LDLEPCLMDICESWSRVLLLLYVLCQFLALSFWELEAQLLVHQIIVVLEHLEEIHQDRSD